MNKYALIFLVFLASTIEVTAQKILVGKKIDFNYSAIDRDNNVIYVYGQTFYKKILLDNLSIESHPITVEKEFNTSNYDPIIVDSIHYFVHKQGGLVYQNRNDSIVRIDNSFNHLMQAYSAIFSYKSKIHKFGGYGFWSARNFITFFDNDLNEWEIVNPLNSVEVPEGFLSGLHILIDDELFVFNSYYINPLNRYEDIFNKKLWKYNYIEKKWTHLGDIEFIKQINNIPPVIYGDKLLINEISKLIVIDVRNNIYSEFEKGKAAYYFDRNFKSFFHNNRFYYLTIDDSENLFISIATASEVIGKEIYSTNFYRNNAILKNIGIIIIVLIIGILLYLLVKRFRKQKNKILVLKNGLYFKKMFVPLDKETYQILMLLLKQEVVNSSELIKIVEKEQFSRAHNERLKFQKIEELNVKLQTLLGVSENIVDSKKSKYDRRIREYSITNKDQFIKK